MPVQIEIDDEVWEVLKARAEPLVDTPNSVLRRIFDLPAARNGSLRAAQPSAAQDHEGPSRPSKPTRRGKRKRASAGPRAQSGTILPHEDYEVPILRILDEHGGRAPTSEVLELLGERLADQLLPADYETLASGDIRWRNRAQFVRLRLVQRGDLRKESPRGLWEITDQGRDRLVAS